MKDYKDYFYKKMPDVHFGVDIFLKNDLAREQKLKTHWHEHMQMYYFICGSAMLECNMKRFIVRSQDIVVINSNELHYMESLSDDLQFYVIRVDLPFLFSNQVDLCQTKYLAPLSQNRITLRNLIRDDTEVLNCVVKTIDEYSTKRIGFELAVKSSIYQLIVLLLRGHIHKIMSSDEFSSRVNSLKRFDTILKFIAAHYTEKISVKDLAEKANITVFYFCRIFKQLTGKTMTDYINELRLEKSLEYLQSNDLNITEVALNCGFEGVNYYSRLFRKHYHISPTKFRENNMEK
ncbi:helix-turn-helix domain-containing protein [Sporomusa acidovorans]|uniref:HTH-type transcriptional activator RhaS n=1 Tax=Sporomusa acidovorans (strain ATCC 49682 / DSM 3132 / Mol) TaxID=1123286 RepID=A0ABZ3IYH9_SPOA4|nr:AraC family transcriptional regulator [Sporomusa acidovorans]OZC16970.1 HTH-type transcriptional activator RhaS [Sporomusa acidovorans DSM 3132]SDE14040.1 AraC-type DNA-binding protein [Sporomusa acidovorans]